MTEVNGQKIIKIEEVDVGLQKKLDKNKLFKFECETMSNKLRLGLKEINCYSPYYYEGFYTKEELDNEYPHFTSLSLEIVKEQLIALFNQENTILKQAENGNIIVSFKIQFFTMTKETNFELVKKTIDNKDDGLIFLFGIQKKNIEIINKIREQCLKNPNEEVSQRILQLLLK